MKKVDFNIKTASLVLLIEEALRRKIKIKLLNDYQCGNAFMEFSYRGHNEYFKGTNCSRTTATANYITSNKALAKDFLGKHRIETPEGKLFLSKDVDKIKEFAEKTGYSVVLKKYNGTHGDLVFVGIENFKEGKNILKKHFWGREKYILVEKQFKGREYRFIATKEKVLAVVYREPANVIGDGKNTIEELIAEKNSDPRRGDNYSKSLIKIRIDDHLKSNLKKQKLRLNSVIPAGKKVYLRNNSNLSTGGDSIDVTDEVHPYLNKTAVKAINSIPGLAYAGIDIMIKESISKKPGKGGYVVLELNSSPMISMHHCPYEGKSRDVAGGIIDVLFPETKGK